jgi:hypothetical protein
MKFRLIGVAPYIYKVKCTVTVTLLTSFSFCITLFNFSDEVTCLSETENLKFNFFGVFSHQPDHFINFLPYAKACNNLLATTDTQKNPFRY